MDQRFRDSDVGHQSAAGLESVDDRMISLMRLILALSALVITFIDPSEPDRLVAVTYGALVVYSVYGAILYYLSFRRSPRLPLSISHWIDVGCFLVLVALSSGTNSIFFFFFFFAILVASFRWGFNAGLRVTIISTLFFGLIGYTTTHEDNFELDRFLLRPVYLLVLGYMIAYWGGHEIKLKRRLNLLKEINLLANPKFGVSETIGALLERLRAFYQADDCWLIISDVDAETPRLFRLSQSQTFDAVAGESLPPKLAQSLLAPAADVGILYQRAAETGLLRRETVYAVDLKRKIECSSDLKATARSLAAQFEMDAFISVPAQYRNRDIGRLFLVARPGIFERPDLEFLMQVAEQAMPVVQNIRLLDRLATTAAEHERQRLARDIHDSVIQRYIGLQYKVAAIRNKLAQGANVSADVDHLFAMTVNEVNNLRGFAQGLKESDVHEGFLPAVRRFASQFSDNYNLEVQVVSEDEITIKDRLAAELIQIVQEGLSNIRKHTDATTSRISVQRVNGSVALTIENNRARIDPAEPFTPRSIAERAHELGGEVNVICGPDDRTVVRVQIPL
ncbi:MAG TPA: histidine kinase [Pyrinomonadaceae bacterium]|nr:histidine kinase [Pyrinomonadaceae bacterium]